MPTLPAQLYDRRIQIILAGVAALAIVSYIHYSQMSQTGLEFKVTGPVISNPVSPLQKTNVGGRFVKSYQEFATLHLTDQGTKNDITTYSYDSAVPKVSNTILVKNGQVYSEKIAIPTNVNQQGYVTTTYLVKLYGKPDKSYYAQTYYGPLNVMIWGNKGLAAKTDILAGTVRELQVFRPMSADDYITQLGDPQIPANSPLLKEGP